MGNFISKAWDKLTGADAAKKANKLQEQALAQQQSEADKSNKLREEVLAQYKDLTPMIMGMLTGNVNSATNPMAAQSYRILNQLLGNLTGENKTAEQQQADQYTQNFIDMLTNPTADQQKADALTDSLVTSLTTPTGKSDEQKTADEWNAKYLSSLSNSPDTAFNAGVAELARGAETQNENIRKAMQSRGISSSGINLAALGNTAADRARGVSQLQGQRVDRQTQNTAAGAQFAQGLADRQLDLEDRQLNHQGIAVDLATNKANNALQRYGQATELTTNKADKSTNDIINALNTSNNWNQQAWNNLMGLLSGQTSLINNQAGANYAAGLNNLAEGYNAQASGQSGLVGNILGKAATSTAGKTLVNKVGTTALGGVQKILGLLGL